ncbi:MAG TPA: C40 family peptidase [Thermoanaerobaculia bacterium]
MRAGALLLMMIAAAPAVMADAADTIVREARESIGIRYSYGRTGVKATDCAGLTRRVAATAGVKLPRTTGEQYRVGQPVKRDELAPGDLVFFRNTYKRGISHVGIYIGEGRFIHAASRQRYVVIDELDQPYFRTRFAGGRRIVERVKGPNPAAICAVP